MQSPRRFDTLKYNEYVKRFKNLSIARDKTITHSELRLPGIDLPDARWLVANCPDKNVDSFAKFVSWCGFSAKGQVLPKEKATELIFQKASRLHRPLKYDDFRGDGCCAVTISTVKKHWGTFNKMKTDLGLEVIQESMLKKHVSKDDFINYIENIIADLCSTKDFLVSRELNESTEYLNWASLNRLSKRYYNKSFSVMLKGYGIRTVSGGRGLVYDFEDGERVTSYYEYLFSKYLRDFGLNYNQSYFRDVCYSSFDEAYTGNMNCDYVIHYNNKIIYVEIAGLLEAYKDWYYKNRTITASKSRDKYRLKLREKEAMLSRNNLIYYILFPCDLTRDNFLSIINSGSVELR